MYPESALEFKNALRESIDQFNSEKHSFKLQEVDRIDSSGIELDVKNIKLASGARQAGSIGLQAATLFAVGYLAPILLTTAAFPYMLIMSMMPCNRTYLDVRLSRDLSDSLSPKIGVEFRNSAFLASKKNQLKKVEKRLPKHYRSLFYAIDARYKQHRVYYNKKDQQMSR